MATELEDLRVLRVAEGIADEIWKCVEQWDVFARDVIGGQLARAADSVGANIAEAYGRYHYGDKLQFLYYARGSLFETKYWLNRAAKRQLVSPKMVSDFTTDLSNLAQQLNGFVRSIRQQRSGKSQPATQIREATLDCTIDSDASTEFILPNDPLFTNEDLSFISE
jgi:four helix bundle protein